MAEYGCIFQYLQIFIEHHIELHGYTYFSGLLGVFSYNIWPDFVNL